MQINPTNNASYQNNSNVDPRNSGSSTDSHKAELEAEYERSLQDTVANAKRTRRSAELKGIARAIS